MAARGADDLVRVLIDDRFVPDPEVSLQLWPYVFGLAGPVLVGLAVSKLTASRFLGVLAILLGFGTANLAQYAIFVHPYSLDYAVTALLLLLGLLYVLVYRSRTSQELQGFWLDGFAPTSSLADLWRFLATTGWTAVKDALPGPLAWVAPSTALGLLALTLTLPRLSEEGGPGIEVLDGFLAGARPSRLFFLAPRGLLSRGCRAHAKLTDAAQTEAGPSRGATGVPARSAQHARAHLA